jgi:hypothetical protein
MRVKLIGFIGLCLVLLSTSCGGGFKVGETRIITAVLPTTFTNAGVEFGIYPGIYTVGNFFNPYVKGATIELGYTIFSDLDFPSSARIFVYHPSTNALESNKGYSDLANLSDYCMVVDDGQYIPAHGSKTTTIRVFIPEGTPDIASKWIFYVGYQLDGHRWGNYTTTQAGNFVFTPGDFNCIMTDFVQQMTWLTWGNSPLLMVRMSYDTPPATIADGEQVYLGNGEQVIRPWLDPESGQILQRQYSLFNINMTEHLSASGGDKLFYRAWQQHMVNGQWDGTWDAIGQSLVIPEVQAKVLINM